MFRGFGFLDFICRISGFGFRVLGFGASACFFRDFRVRGFRISGFGFRLSGFGFRVSDFGHPASILGYRVPGIRLSGFGVKSLGFGV